MTWTLFQYNRNIKSEDIINKTGGLFIKEQKFV